ncbi:hypothetical protein AWC17_13325 [Mycobacterium nebraskense]|uniref:PE domain-containing protein n=1 Tax=Mycobacterium nebraskense TaxID=244292 RepID=A0A1X1Z1H3_9MYCO|nr:PE domain-containing protein [Mycobacterium nebraskense]ORW17175.1 hypothetical protein AWC17_13325 [Mycobacterium nebraskense]
MILDVEPEAVAVQSATEAAGTAESAGVLTGATPALVVAPPMGGEEVSMAISAAIMAHAAQFTAQTGLGVGQRGLYAAQLGVSSATYAAANALSAAALAL